MRTHIYTRARAHTHTHTHKTPIPPPPTGNLKNMEEEEQLVSVLSTAQPIEGLREREKERRRALDAQLSRFAVA